MKRIKKEDKKEEARGERGEEGWVERRKKPSYLVGTEPLPAQVTA